jgi:uncharacterized membrane protein YfcA
MLIIVTYVVLGLVVGGFSGVLGIGGGIILIPALMWLFGFDHRKAIGTTLGVMVPPIGLPAAVQYHALNNLDLQAAAWIAVGFVAGSYGGAHLAPLVPREALSIGFGMLLLYVGFRFVFLLDADVRGALIGFGLVTLSVVALVVLKVVGRHYRLKNLAEEIRKLPPPPREPEYYI